MKSRQQSGFTLIELVMVIVILGILSAVAIPQFIDMRVEARKAATQGVAGALAAASAINFSARVAGNATGKAVTGDLAGCTLHSTMLQGGLPTGYSIGGAAPACTVTVTGGVAENWTAIVVP